MSVRGDIDGPVLLIRADIDALRIQEESRTSCASTRPGVMHACGHDGHTEILLGFANGSLVAKGRSAAKSGFFQPAEKPVPGGVPALIEAGVLEGAAAVVHPIVAAEPRRLSIGQVRSPPPPLRCSRGLRLFSVVKPPT
ncbi:M20/M25/M40 family metallo-hydrolase [Nocardia sp. NPDC059246]|uniref:M20/M25/M40 family metallo-hydrolase n=1 Tax=unclassified Nocardia TaxID=2637762 RepID=UPI0036A8A296